MYVTLIKKTIIDSRYFMLMFVICVCAFGNAVMIINRFDSNTDQYERLFPSAFNNSVFDSFINQFMVGVGEFTYDNYENNPSKSLLWMYFIAATFLTQIVFFNMLIAVMASSYEEVVEH